MTLLGIDFGTANLRVVAAPSTGEPRGANVSATPAIVGFHAGHVSVGEPVLMMAAAVPDVVVRGVKRLVGVEAHEQLTRRFGARAGWTARITGDELELAASETAMGHLTVTAAVANLLRYAVSSVVASGPHEAVIAVPAWFTASQRSALARAAARAEIRVLRYVNDSVAAALWAAHTQGLRGRFASIDVGAGGVSGSIVRITGDTVQLEAAAGSGDTGGDEVDAAIAGAALEMPKRREWELMIQASEALKRELSATDVVKKAVHLGERRVELCLERWELELMLSALIKSIAAVASELLSSGAGPDALLAGEE